ncbi:MAG TPA: SRPBCC domain-containing protein, partial [Ktedonobacteraceae bacterium]|nr:SRPBCC domain-containing protein [Ktedonobacteraceae bacterium]
MEKAPQIGRSIEKELFIKASPERVFRALTEKEELERWFMKEAEVDLRPGGAIRFEWRLGVTNVGKILVFD